MSKVNNIIKLSPVLLLSMASSGYAQNNDAELMTLFTTAQERELIDNNRYKKQQVETKVIEVTNEPEVEIEKQEVKIEVKLAGVTLSQSGQNIAWVNGRAYENGAKLEDGSIVYISSKLNSLVQIKTPDGKYHSVVAGEKVDISYYKSVKG